MGWLSGRGSNLVGLTYIARQVLLISNICKRERPRRFYRGYPRSLLCQRFRGDTLVDRLSLHLVPSRFVCSVHLVENAGVILRDDG